MPHSNLTRERTPYPAPAQFYGSGWYYTAASVADAERVRTVHMPPKPTAATIQPIASIARQPAPSPIPDRVCVQCGKTFAPSTKSSRVCSPACVTERKRDQWTASNAKKRKARVA